MRWVFPCFLVILTSSCCLADTVGASLGDLLEAAKIAERRYDQTAALDAYLQIDQLRPNDAAIKLKIATILRNRSRVDEAAKYALQAFELAFQDPLSSPEFRKAVCSQLVGQHYRYGMTPFSKLNKEDQQKVINTAPVEMLFPLKSDEAAYWMSADDQARAIDCMVQAILAGDWREAGTVTGKTRESRDKVIAIYKAKAQSTNNPHMWLALLSTYWQTGQTSGLKESFPTALEAIKDDPRLLEELSELLSRMSWQEGLATLRGLSESSPRTQVWEYLHQKLNDAIAAQDLVATRGLMIRVTADYPESRGEIVKPAIIRQMLRNGWDALLRRILPTEAMGELDSDLRRIILTESATERSRFDYWVKAMATSPGSSSIVNTVYDAAGRVENTRPERAIWILEQGVRLFPDEPALAERLASMYARNGFTEKGMGLLAKPFLLSLHAGKGESRALDTLLRLAKDANQTKLVGSWLWENREKMQVQLYIAVAKNSELNNDTRGAMKWIDAAYARAKETGLALEIASEVQSAGAVPQTQRGRTVNDIDSDDPLYSLETYLFRLKLLLALNRSDDLKAVLAEAELLYSYVDFTQRMPEITKVVPIDWNKRITLAKQQLRVAFETTAQPASAKTHDPCQPLIQTACALAKTGQAATVEALALELMPDSKPWQDGLRLATQMFVNGAAAVMPFAKWTAANSLPNSDKPLVTAAYSITSTIESQGETSLADAYSLLLNMITPGKPQSPDSQAYEVAGYRYSPQFAAGWQEIKPEDRPAVRKQVAEAEISAYALARYTYEWSDPLFGEMINELHSQRTNSAFSMLWLLYIQSKTMPAIDMNAKLDQIEKATDWSAINSETVRNLINNLKARGLDAQAERVRAIVAAHVDPSQRQALISTDSGANAAQRTLSTSRTSYTDLLSEISRLYEAGKPAEAKIAWIEAYEKAETNYPKAQALGTLAVIDPTDTVERISKSLPDLLIRDYSSGFQGLNCLARALYAAAGKDHTLAQKAALLVDKVASADAGWARDYLVKERAFVHFWAGDTEVGIKMLMNPLSFDGPQLSSNLADLMDAVVLADVPVRARAAALTRMTEYAKDSWIGMSIWSQAMEYSDVTEMTKIVHHNQQDEFMIDYSPEGLISLSALLQKEVRRATIDVSSSFLETTLKVALDTARRSDLKPEVASSWVALFRAAYAKSSRTPDKAAEMHAWLDQRVQNLSNHSDFNKTQTFRDLSQMLVAPRTSERRKK